MKIGIDISQLAFENTGVANYYKNLVQKLLEIDKKNQYILFFSSLRRNLNTSFSGNFTIRRFRIPPTILDLIWNKFHIFPIENFIGEVDIFITSDWTEPPAKKAKKATILYDLIVYKYPQESHSKTEFSLSKLLISPNIVKSQKRKLEWVKKESSKVFCISEATKEDAKEILGLSEQKLEVLYPGL